LFGVDLVMEKFTSLGFVASLLLRRMVPAFAGTTTNRCPSQIKIECDFLANKEGE